MKVIVPLKLGTAGVAILVIGVLGSIPQSRGSTLLTFDDLSPGTSYAPIPGGYGGLSWWYNFDILNATQYPSSYSNGIVSSPNVAFNVAGDSASFSHTGLFDLNSAYLTAVFVNGLSVRVQGYNATTLLYDNTYILGTNPTFINFNYSQVKYVSFQPTPSSMFAMDNLIVTHTNGPTAANFSVSSASGQVPMTVQFLDQSTGSITNWEWNFGDGAAHAAVANPSHTYVTDGNFSTTLTVTDNVGLTNSKTTAITVSPAAMFAANPTSGPAPLNVQLNDQSTGNITNWDWDFGDLSAHGSTQNPSHTYTNTGVFTINLVVTGRSGLSNSKSSTITATPISDFIANPRWGQVPLTVQFTNKSIGIVTNLDWNFGDGSPHSSAQNPAHTYSSSDNFIASLTVTGSNALSNTKSTMIAVALPPPCSSPASPPVNPGMVQGWGCNSYGAINTGCLSNVVAIAAGQSHSLLLMNDGTVVALGAYSSAPVVVPSGLTNVIAVAGGDFHSLALKSDGTVVAWGDDTYGQTSVPPGLTNVVAISAGSLHSLALLADGTVVGFGTIVPPSLSNVVAISGGFQISLALKDDGTVSGWNLARGADPSSLSNIVAISAGDDCCYEAGEALRADGTLLLGSAFTNAWTPVGSGIVSISASRGTDGHISWALRADGTVFAIPYGYNFCGGPSAPDGLFNVVAVASGDAHDLALVGNGPPLLRTPLLSPIWDTNGFRVSAQTENGRVYRLEFKNSLDETNWIARPLVAGTGKLQTLSDPTALGTQRFYRVRRW